MHPVNEFECLFMTMILFFGVAIFSYIMNEFRETLCLCLVVRADLDDSDNLDNFLNAMKKFNTGQPLHEKLVSKIKRFFEYKW